LIKVTAGLNFFLINLRYKRAAAGSRFKTGAGAAEGLNPETYA
jgi:hypothetical protein